MSYNNDQFYNIGDAGERRGSTTFPAHHNWNGGHANNPHFVYPSRAVRYLDDQGNLVTKNLKRGYIRSLTTNVQGQDFPIQKCQFQFNPQTIVNDVSLANSYYDVLHQPPEQFTQPMPGGVNFTFTLLFDRSMEINNPAFGFDRINEANPWEKSDPSQVGVLRDLQAFYAVIGQGISDAQKDFLIAKLQNTTTLEARRRQDSGDELSQTDVDSAVGSAEDFIGNNVGNNSFLIPVPVRVLFSSLYMVEGIVTNTNTELLKFNTSMVPMIAKVTVSMEAKYVGFAREKTYLTDQLAKTVEAYEEEQKEEASRINDMSNSLLDGIGQIQMAYGDEDAGRAGRYPGEGVKDVSITDLLEGAVGSDYYLWFRIPDAYNNDENTMNKLFDDGDSLGIAVTATQSVYGPFTEAEFNLFNGDQDAMDAKCRPAKLLLQARGVFNVSTKTEWNRRARATRSDKVETNTQISDVASKYFISRYEGMATVLSDQLGAVNANNSVVGFGTFHRAWGPGFTGDDDDNGLERALTLVWPRATMQDGQTTLVAGVLGGDNTATDPKPAGSTSSVGKRGSTGSRNLRIS